MIIKRRPEALRIQQRYTVPEIFIFLCQFPNYWVSTLFLESLATLRTRYLVLTYERRGCKG